MVSKQENCLPHITDLTFPGASAFPTQEEKDQMAAEVSQPPTSPPRPPPPRPAAPSPAPISPTLTLPKPLAFRAQAGDRRQAHGPLHRQLTAHGGVLRHTASHTPSRTKS